MPQLVASQPAATSVRRSQASAGGACDNLRGRRNGQATDPTASVQSFRLNDGYTANLRGIDDSLNLGVNCGQVVSFAGHKSRPNIEAGCDPNDDYGNPKRTIRASIVLLLPTH